VDARSEPAAREAARRQLALPLISSMVLHRVYWARTEEETKLLELQGCRADTGHPTWRGMS
jgi:hypothetical protein